METSELIKLLREQHRGCAAPFPLCATRLLLDAYDVQAARLAVQDSLLRKYEYILETLPVGLDDRLEGYEEEHKGNGGN